MRTNLAGLELIKRSEGLRLEAYVCPAGVPTIGYGHTGDVKLGTRISEHQAEVVLAYDLERVEEGVAELAPGANANQFSAMVALAFNIGMTAFAKSGVLREHKRGNHALAATCFANWTRGGGQILPGLIKRRAAEAALYLEAVQ